MGERRVAIIDPGPAHEAHVASVAAAVAGAESVTILVTHGHPDHAPGARGLAATLEAAGSAAEVGGPQGVEGVDHTLADGDAVATDQGDLIAVDTPGHARAHVAFHWPSRSALFAGDLLLGIGDTVWVGEYPGAVADYLRSLERVRSLQPAVIYPAHGPPLTSPAEAIDRYTSHRMERIRQVEDALARRPDAGVDELVAMIYGPTLPEVARRAARMSMEALKAHVQGVHDEA